MKFVHMISQGCSIFKSFEAQLTVHCGILFMLMYSIEMNFQVVRVWENFLAKLTCSFIKQAYKENIKGDRDTKKILFSSIDIYGICCCAFSEPVDFYTSYCTVHTQKFSRRSDECHENALTSRLASRTVFHKKDRRSALLEIMTSFQSVFSVLTGAWGWCLWYTDMCLRRPLRLVEVLSQSSQINSFPLFSWTSLMWTLSTSGLKKHLPHSGQGFEPATTNNIQKEKCSSMKSNYKCNALFKVYLQT